MEVGFAGRAVIILVVAARRAGRGDRRDRRERGNACRVPVVIRVVRDLVVRRGQDRPGGVLIIVAAGRAVPVLVVAACGADGSDRVDLLQRGDALAVHVVHGIGRQRLRVGIGLLRAGGVGEVLLAAGAVVVGVRARNGAGGGRRADRLQQQDALGVLVVRGRDRDGLRVCGGFFGPGGVGIELAAGGAVIILVVARRGTDRLDRVDLLKRGIARRVLVVERVRRGLRRHGGEFRPGGVRIVVAAGRAVVILVVAACGADRLDRVDLLQRGDALGVHVVREIGGQDLRVGRRLLRARRVRETLFAAGAVVVGVSSRGRADGRNGRDRLHQRRPLGVYVVRGRDLDGLRVCGGFFGPGVVGIELAAGRTLIIPVVARRGAGGGDGRDLNDL